MPIAPVLYPGSDPIEISISPVSFSSNVAATNGTTSAVATISISGGIPPYTATWLSDNGNVIPVDDVSVTTTAFEWANLGGAGDSEYAVITVTVYDAILNSASFNYSATITRTR